MYVCVNVNVIRCACVRVCVCLCVCSCLCACPCAYVYMCICIFTSPFGLVFISIPETTCIVVSQPVSLHTYSSLSAAMCVHRCPYSAAYTHIIFRLTYIKYTCLPISTSTSPSISHVQSTSESIYTYSSLNLNYIYVYMISTS